VLARVEDDGEGVIQKIDNCSCRRNVMSFAQFCRAYARMSVSVEVAVMFHPRRAEAAHALAEHLGARLVADPCPDAPPSVPGTGRTARAAWLSLAESGAGYGLVLQDASSSAQGSALSPSGCSRSTPAGS
jgi:hypothetical protein